MIDIGMEIVEVGIGAGVPVEVVGRLAVTAECLMAATVAEVAAGVAAEVVEVEALGVPAVVLVSEVEVLADLVDRVQEGSAVGNKIDSIDCAHGGIDLEEDL